MSEPVQGSAATGRRVVNCPECNAEIVYWATSGRVPEVLHDGGHGSHTLQWGDYRMVVLS